MLYQIDIISLECKKKLLYIMKHSDERILVGVRMSDSFNTMVSLKLDHYVYALCDPEKVSDPLKKVFYIGKGQGNRCFNHAKEERGKKDEPLLEGEHKLAVIRDIRKKGLDVEILIVAHGLSADKAFQMEAVLIPLIGTQNKQSGHKNEEFWLTKPQIQELYDKPVQRKEIDELNGKILFVSLNHQDIDVLQRNDDDMAKNTLGNWAVSEEKSRNVDVIIGVKNKLVVSIYKVEKADSGYALFDTIPREQKHQKNRSKFFGMRMLELEKKLKGRTIFEDEDELTKIHPPGSGCHIR